MIELSKFVESCYSAAPSKKNDVLKSKNLKRHERNEQTL